MPAAPPDRTARSATRRRPPPGPALTAPGRDAAPWPCARMPSRHGTVVCPASSCMRVVSICHAVDRLRRRLEAGLGARQPGQVGAPLLNADRLAAAPVDGHRRDRRRREQARHHGQDVVGVQRVVDARRVHVDGDGVSRSASCAGGWRASRRCRRTARTAAQWWSAARSARRPSGPCPPRRSCRCCTYAGTATRRGCRRAARPRRRRGGPPACRPPWTSSAGRRGRCRWCSMR